MGHAFIHRMWVLLAILAQSWALVGTARQEAIVELREEEVEGGKEAGIHLRLQPELIVVPGLEGVNKTLDLCMVQLVPAFGFSDLPESGHEGNELRVRARIEQRA